ncbi:hypothetical protein MVEN_00335800 [Mycena venus]|uniref:Uncharacterized protein n=1 Tax=Mycena venus TaxID=2733690 RepID=A0A8H7DAA5_9AGAR|nr:hypothetical protein MVEN_00335800 [Mycena venus]
MHPPQAGSSRSSEASDPAQSPYQSSIGSPNTPFNQFHPLSGAGHTENRPTFPHAPFSDSLLFSQTPVHHNHSIRSTNSFYNSEAETIVRNASQDQLFSNPRYKFLYDRVIALESRLEMLNSAYTVLATSIPRVFTMIPNPLNIPVPTAANIPAVNTNGPATFTAPSPPILIQANYPNVAWWFHKDYKSHSRESGDHVVFKKSKTRSADSDDDSDSNDGEDDDDETPNLLAFLEHEDGTKFTSEETDFVRESARGEFQSYLVEELAPPKWSERTAQVTTRFRNNMIAQVPELNLCAHFWKVDTVGTKLYAQWSRYCKTDIAAYWKKTSSTRRSKKRKPKNAPTRDSTDEPSAKRSRKDSTLASPDFASLISMDIDSPDAVLTPSFPPVADIITPTVAPAPVPVPVIASSDTSVINIVSNPDSIPDPNQPPAQPPAPASSVNPLSSVVQPPLHNVVPTSVPANGQKNPSKVKDPLSGLFPEVIPVPSPRLAVVQAAAQSAADSSNSSNDASAPASAPAVAPAKTTGKKAVGNSTPHAPGKANTPWNVFGRRYCAEQKKLKRRPHTTEVREAFDALSPDEMKEIIAESKRLKEEEEAEKNSQKK